MKSEVARLLVYHSSCNYLTLACFEGLSSSFPTSLSSTTLIFDLRRSKWALRTLRYTFLKNHTRLVSSRLRFSCQGGLRSRPLPIIRLCLLREEGMIHFFVGSHVKMPDSGLFSGWLRNNTSEKPHSDWQFKQSGWPPVNADWPVNLTGRADVCLFKLEGGWRYVK